MIEVDKTRQLLLIVNNGKVGEILNTSTGSGLPYQYAGQTYTALTPSGQFTIFRQVDGDDPGPLGDLWRPKYFNGGIAIHGAASIPGYPGQPRVRAPVRCGDRLDLEQQPGAHRHQRVGLLRLGFCSGGSHPGAAEPPRFSNRTGRSSSVGRSSRAGRRPVRRPSAAIASSAAARS